jgi:hypothetical protein
VSSGATGRVTRLLLADVSGQPVPWPQLSIANLGGAIIHRLNFFRRKRRPAGSSSASR